MKLRHAGAILAIGLVIGGLTGLTRADAQTVGAIYPIDVDDDGHKDGCGGNSKIQDVPIHCGNARDYVVQGVAFTVSVEVVVDEFGNGAAIYTLSRKLPREVPIRVRSHSGISSTPGPLVDDVSGVIPPGQLQAILRFKVGCGQIDVKAVFTGEGDSRGRIAGPYLCTPPPATTTTVPPTAPTTAPETTTPGNTTLPPGTAASTVPSSVSGASSSTLPATGGDSDAGLAWALVILGTGGLLVWGARRRLSA